MDNLASQLFESAVVIVEMFTLYMYLSGIFLRNNLSRLYGVLAYFAFGLVLGAASIFVPNMVLLAVITFMGVLCLARFLYTSHILSAFFASLLYLLVVIAIDTTVPALYSWAFKAELAAIHTFGVERVFATIIVKLVALLAVRVISIIMEKHRDSLQRRMLQSIPLIVCQFILIAVIANIFISSYVENGTLTQRVFIEIVGLFLVDIIILWYYKLLISIHELRSQNEITAMQLENQIKHYGLVKAHQETINAIEHDMKKHIMVVEGMAKAGHEVEVSDYLDCFTDTINENIGLVYTPHPMVSSILSYCRQRAQKACIDLKLEVSVPSQININQIDLTVIMGNTIDNALEALDKMDPDQRRLHISLKQSDYYLYYEIMNTYDVAASKRHKKDKAIHGYGLRNVSNCVDKYEGSINIRENSSEYSVTIMVPCRANSQDN